MKNNDLSIYLRQQRLRAGYTQEKLAKILNVSQPTVSRMETNVTNLTVGVVEKALTVFSQTYINYLTTNWAIHEQNAIETFLQIIFAQLELKTFVLYNPTVAGKLFLKLYKNNKKTL